MELIEVAESFLKNKKSESSAQKEEESLTNFGELDEQTASKIQSAIANEEKYNEETDFGEETSDQLDSSPSSNFENIAPIESSNQQTAPPGDPYNYTYIHNDNDNNNHDYIHKYADEQSFQNEVADQNQTKVPDSIPLCRSKLPTFEEYLNTDQLDEIISKGKVLIDSQEIQDHLTVSPPQNLDQKSVDIFKEKEKELIDHEIRVSDFSEIQKNYQFELTRSKQTIVDKLRQLHEDTINQDFSEMAKEKNEETLSEFKDQFDQKVNDYTSEEEKRYTTKLEQKENQQQLELEHFKASQQSELSQYKDEILAIKQNNVDAFIAQEQKKLDLQCDQCIKDEVDKQITQALNSLELEKSKCKQTLATNVEALSQEYREKINKISNRLERVVEAASAQWKQDIINQQQLDEQKRENDLKQQQLDLTRTQLKLKSEELKSHQHRQESELNQLQDLIKLLQTQALKPAVPVQNSPSTDPALISSLNKLSQKLEQTPDQPQPSSTNTTLIAFLVGVVSVLITVIILGILYFSMSLGSNRSISYFSQPQVERNSESALPSSSHSTVGFETDHGRSKDSMTLQKKIESAKTVEDFDHISSDLRNQGDLPHLKKFNAEYSSTYGDLDQKILENNIWGVFNILKTAPEDYIQHLGADRRMAVMLLLYRHRFFQVGDDTLIKKMI